jgi:TP901 family phage tail tape measure protein
MADKIKGIIIEFGGDVTSLDKALSEVNEKSRSLQKELKGVNSLLKMDPGNTDLLKQKQELLSAAVEETKKKLEALKEAEKQVQVEFEKGNVNEEQYRDLQREIAATEQKLKSLEDETKNFGSTTAQQLEQVGKKFQTAGDTISGIGQKMLPITGAITAAGGATLSLASSFEDAMAKVSTIADTTEVPLEDLEKAIIELSDQSGISAVEIANNVYDAISAGQSTADAVDFLRNSTALAKAGFTSSASALDILTTTLNAYGLEASEAGRVSDVLIMTQNLGKTTVDQLASSMGKVIPTAKANGVSIENLAAMYAVMTSNGIATAESTTYMNSMLNELGKSGSKAAVAFAKGTEHIKEGGLTMAEAMESGWELTDVLSILDEQAAESGTTIANMFGSAEAGKAANVLWDNATKLNDVVTQMGESAGATEDAFEKLDTSSNKAKIALNQAKKHGNAARDDAS